MSERFFYSDPHFYHDGVRSLPGREQFRDGPVEEMNEVLIDNWNSVVGKRDLVYGFGDWGYDRKMLFRTAIRPRLNGRIYTIGGNHDTAEILSLFDKVNGVLVKHFCGYHCVMTHIPIHPQEMYWDLNIHGHLHSNVVRKYQNQPLNNKVGEVDKRYLNVCVEHMAFTPQPCDEVVLAHMGEPNPIDPRRKKPVAKLDDET